ncbi:hypothetical protein FB451DRAFT_1035630, partial [Mycena latifolia]
RRRNRMTQSCLHCHTTKRMCDRQRPCSRCSQLGLSGHCVYEDDDPNRQSQKDEHARLTNRIAELEAVIRELRNKSHPRWLVEQERSLVGSSHSSLSSGDSITPNTLAGELLSSPRYAPGFWSPSPVSPGSPYHGNNPFFKQPFSAGIMEHIPIERSTCGCLNEAESYQAILELSIRLRRATDVLTRFPSHSGNSDCILITYISELDELVKSVCPLCYVCYEADILDILV